MIAGYISYKRNIYDPYKREFTLDGEKNKLRVKRDYKLKECVALGCLVIINFIKLG